MRQAHLSSRPRTTPPGYIYLAGVKVAPEPPRAPSALVDPSPPPSASPLPEDTGGGKGSKGRGKLSLFKMSSRNRSARPQSPGSPNENKPDEPSPDIAQKNTAQFRGTDESGGGATGIALKVGDSGAGGPDTSDMMTDKHGNWVGWMETWQRGEIIARNPTIVTKDHELAAQYFRKAADQKHPEAQCSLGQCYMEGKVLTRALKRVNSTQRSQSYRNRARIPGHHHCRSKF